MESRNLYVKAARLCRHLITIIIIIAVSSAVYLITYGITQPRDHNHAKQTVLTTLQVCEYYE